jgi:small subunit ribosomal protein S6e
MPLVCVINDTKTGKSYQKQLDHASLSGRKIGDTLPGGILGLAGYELQITGGSDTAGFPLKKELDGGARKKMLLKHGDPGVRDVRKGDLVRKTVRGNAITEFVAQVNLKTIKHGIKSVDELLGVAKEATEGTEHKSGEEKKPKEASEKKK